MQANEYLILMDKAKTVLQDLETAYKKLTIEELTVPNIVEPKVKISNQERSKIYYQKNREKHLKHMKDYYCQAIQPKKTMCFICNCEVLESKLGIHQNTKKHLMKIINE